MAEAKTHPYRPETSRLGPDPQNRFYKLDETLLWDRRLKPVAKLALMDIFHHERKGRKIGSVSQRCGPLGVSRDALAAAERSLCEAGFLIRRERIGCSPLYFATYPVAVPVGHPDRETFEADAKRYFEEQEEVHKRPGRSRSNLRQITAGAGEHTCGKNPQLRWSGPAADHRIQPAAKTGNHLRRITAASESDTLLLSSKTQKEHQQQARSAPLSAATADASPQAQADATSEHGESSTDDEASRRDAIAAWCKPVLRNAYFEAATLRASEVKRLVDELADRQRLGEVFTREEFTAICVKVKRDVKERHRALPVSVTPLLTEIANHFSEAAEKRERQRKQDWAHLASAHDRMLSAERDIEERLYTDEGPSAEYWLSKIRQLREEEFNERHCKLLSAAEVKARNDDSQVQVARWQRLRAYLTGSLDPEEFLFSESARASRLRRHLQRVEGDIAKAREDLESAESSLRQLQANEDRSVIERFRAVTLAQRERAVERAKEHLQTLQARQARLSDGSEKGT